MLDKAKNRGTPRPYLRNINVRWFDFDLSDLLEMPFLDEESARFTAVRGDVLICEGGYPGRAAIWNEDYPIHFQKAIHRVRFHEQERNRWFLYFIYYLETTGQLRQYYTGTGIQHFTGEALARLPVPIPPIAEQRRIVGILDEAFDGIANAKANAEKNLQNARALFERYLEAVFTRRGEGWVKKRLGEVAKTQYGLSEPMNEEGKGFKIFRMGELQDGRLMDTGRMKFADIERAEFEKYKLQPGDVLFNRTNSFELVGKTGIFALPGDYCFASYLVRVLLNPKTMIPEFLNYFMSSGQFQSSVKRKASRSINQANINATILSNEMIRFPESLELQDSIVRQLDSLRGETRRLESIYRQKLAALDELKKSLLHRAFCGQL